MVDITYDEDGASFYIRTKGKVTGDSYSGKFKVVTTLSPLEYVKADRLRRQLLGDNSLYADDIANQYVFMLSQLHYRVIEGPLWWKSDLEVNGGHIKDKNVLSEILDVALQAQEEYQAKQAKLFDDLQEKIVSNYANIPDDINQEEDDPDADVEAADNNEE